MASDSPNVPLSKLIQVQRKKQGSSPFAGTLVSFDPGETTGYAVITSSQSLDVKLQEAGHLGTGLVPRAYSEIIKVIEAHQPHLIVMEDYRVYSWRTETHTWASLHTPKLIGAIQALAYERGVGVHLQMAQMPKKFVTNDKLQLWDLWAKGQTHAQDAIRHGVYYLIFGEQGEGKS